MLPLLLALSARAAEPPALATPYLPGEAVEIDGVLDEAVWQKAAVVDDFRRWRPTAGGPSAGLTEARIWYDEHRVYFGFTCEDPDPSRVRAHVLPREDINIDDQIGIQLDTFYDQRSAFVFWVNALGVQQDFRNSVSTGPLFQWDTVWQSRGVRTERGYTVEVAIPWKSLRYPSSEPQEWGVILQRKVAADGEYFSWPALDPNTSNTYQQAARLTGMRPPDAGARLEIIPSLTTTSRWARDDADELGWQPPARWTDLASPGLDLRYGPTPDLSIDAAINPDFSQIEADPFLIDVNLRYALYFDERRPFFQEGVDAWSDVGDTLYTRSIVDPLWALKATGRAGATQGGLLHAYDASPNGSLVAERSTPGFDDEDVAGHGALDQVVRAQHDFGESVRAGLLYAEKDIVDEENLDLLAWNRVGALDLSSTFAERYGVEASLRGSATAQVGQAARPGADGYLHLYRGGNSGWAGKVELRHRTEDFRAETSYVTQTGFTRAGTFQRYRFEPSRGPVFVQPGAELYVTQRTDDGAPLEHWAGGNAEIQATDTTYVEVGGGHGGELYGETLFSTPYAWAWVQSEPLAWLGFAVGVEGGATIDYASSALARTARLDVGLDLRPLPNVQIETDLARQRIWSPAGDRLYDELIARGEANVQFTRDLGVRAISQWSRADASLESSVLMGWLPAPGTAAWLGYSERDTTGDWRTEERAVFGKLSWLFRI